jgi:hypothetical protein
VPQYLEYLLSRQRLRSLRESAEFHPLLQGGDTDFEEFVEVGAGDAEKSQPLQQRHVGILRQREYPLVELQHAEFAVDIQIGGWQGGRVHGLLYFSLAGQYNNAGVTRPLTVAQFIRNGGGHRAPFCGWRR